MGPATTLHRSLSCQFNMSPRAWRAFKLLAYNGSERATYVHPAVGPLGSGGFPSPPGRGRTIPSSGGGGNTRVVELTVRILNTPFWPVITVLASHWGGEHSHPQRSGSPTVCTRGRCTDDRVQQSAEVVRLLCCVRGPQNGLNFAVMHSL
jgi:hypothetical protein